MTNGRRRGPYARTRVRREQIATAALDLVAEKGYRAVTTSEVAERAGISEAGLLYHFPTKEAVLVAALERFDEVELSHLLPGEALSGASTLADLGVHRTAIVDLYAAMLGAASDPSHPAHDYFKSRWEQSAEQLAGDIRALQETSEVAADLDPKRAAHWILAAWDGLQYQWLIDPSFDLGAELDQVIHAFLAWSPSRMSIAKPSP